MALKTITITKSEILKCKEKRFDVKYFLTDSIFKKFEAKTSFTITTIEKLNAKIVSGSYIDNYITKENGYPYLRVGNIKPFAINEEEKSLVFVSKNIPEKIKVKENDIVMGRTQATAAKLAVASIIDKKNANSVISQHVSKITVDENIISPYYLAGYFNSKFYQAQTSLATHGDTRVELTHSQLNKVRILRPEKNILNKISIKVKKIIEYNRQSINKIEQSQTVFYQKLNIDFSKIQKEKTYSVNLSDFFHTGFWTPMFSNPLFVNSLKAIKDNFETIQLGKIATIKKGDEVGSSNYMIALDKKEKDIPFIRTSDLVNYEIDQFPDYYVPFSIYKELQQDVKSGDILYTKDGKIGMAAMVTANDKTIISSGIVRLRLKPEAKKYNLTAEYIFTVLSLKETGLYQAMRRTVIGSTIPHLREDRLKEFEIPILDKNSVDNITKLIKEAFELKNEKKKLIKEVKDEIDSYFNI
ncbi:MAG: hypothetical protein FWG57_02790 [Endomicrobia bacterium]|nr:hypothetical protein [Endomicrobiia bacterium]